MGSAGRSFAVQSGMNLLCPSYVRRKAVWGPKRIVWPTLLLLLGVAQFAAADGRHVRHRPAKKAGLPGAHVKNYRLDDALERLSTDRNGSVNTSRVIVELVPGAQLPNEFKTYARRFAVGGSNSDGVDHNLDIINGLVLELPNNLLKKLAGKGEVFRVHLDRPAKSHIYRTSVTVGARTVQESLGYTGKGISIAVIDSGITTWHDDLTNKTTTLFPYGNQRVRKFVDFVNGRTAPYDDNGHGSHVAGIITGNGYDSMAGNGLTATGTKIGIAPDANIIALKVLDAQGTGTISHIIAALNWVADNATTYNIKVVNMSIGAGIYESYWTDPLTVATKKITDKGITVVAAAGNMGKNAAGHLQSGAITAPGNAPWVLTVGASSTMGTLTRNDDTMADYSSSGPTMFDFDAKPDLVAPGTGTVSLAVPGSYFYALKAQNLVDGKIALASKPYLTLSGTSMSAPVVAGTVALMLQANPNLTPNLIKAILQYTAQVYPGYTPLRQGAGFLNSLGAVRLAKYYYAPKAGDVMPVQSVWSRSIIWGSHLLKKGVIKPSANAWASNIVWGSVRTLGDTGDNIVWGSMGGDGDNIVWGSSDGDNIVWGSFSDGDNIVWGSASDGDNIVWGSDCGGADCDKTMWGELDPGDNIVWGTAEAGDNIVWGSTALGVSEIWASDAGEDNNEAFPDTTTEPLPSLDLEFGDVVPLPTPVKSTTSSLLGGL
jgi:serine protease AprX